jgi:hypothetical protein
MEQKAMEMALRELGGKLNTPECLTKCPMLISEYLRKLEFLESTLSSGQWHSIYHALLVLLPYTWHSYTNLHYYPVLEYKYANLTPIQSNPSQAYSFN